jgi:hypothetical protein
LTLTEQSNKNRLMSLETLSASQLKKAISIAEKIDKLEEQLAGILGASSNSARVKIAKELGDESKRNVSPKGRVRIVAAQKARRGEPKTGSATSHAAGNSGTSNGPASKATKSAPASDKKGGLTEEGRARLAAAMKARWAKAKKSGSAAPTARNKSLK